MKPRGILRRWSRPLRHHVLLWIFLGIEWTSRVIGLSLASRVGEWIGGGVGWLFLRSRARSDQRLTQPRMILDELREPSASSFMIRHGRDLGRRAAEWMVGQSALKLFWCSPETRALLDQSFKNAGHGKGLIVLSAHYGNWELMAAWLSREGWPALAITSSSAKGVIGSWITQKRSALGIQTAQPGGGAKQAIKWLKSGGVVTILIDQSTRERGCTVPFLGADAPLSLTGDRLAQHTDTPTLWVTNKRGSDGRYEICAQTVSGGVREAHLILERCVRVDPLQWVWVHARWTKRVKEKN